MSLPDPGSFMVLVLAAALAGLLIGVLPDWRRMVGHRLPIDAFLRRQGARVDGRAALHAEIRCAMCGAKAQCEQRLGAGARSPIAGCPNSELLKQT
jgi:hypothetical protein